MTPLPFCLRKSSFPGIFLAVLLFLLSGPGAALSAEVRVSASVDKTEATLEDSIKLSIQISGTTQSSPLELPPLPDFKVQSLGTASSVQIKNLKMTSTVTHTYRLSPNKTGKFTIGAVTARLDGKVYKSDPISVVIRKASARQAESQALVFAKAEVSKTRVFVNEQLVLRLKLFRRVDVRNFNVDISYDNFRDEELGKAKDYTQVIEGIQYQVHEIPAALFPTRPGNLKIASARMDLDIVYRSRRKSFGDPFGDFFGGDFFGGQFRSEHKTLRTQPITVEVLPLPDHDKPAHFSNLVGQFSVSASLGKKEIELGDSTTLTLTLSGVGNVRDIPAPTPDWADKFKVYPDQPVFKQWVNGNQIAGGKTFKFALVPLKAGLFSIPLLHFSYFDPRTKKYVTLSTPPLKLNVKPAPEQERLNLTQGEELSGREKGGEIKIIGRDILPLHTRLDDFDDWGWTRSRIAFYAGGMVVPPVIFIGLALFLNFRRRMRYDVAYNRKRAACKRVRRRLEELSEDGKDSARGFCGELSRALREYIGDKLNRSGTALTPAELKTLLLECHCGDELAHSTGAFLENCESLQFTSPSHAVPSRDKLLEESKEIINRLEKVL